MPLEHFETSGSTVRKMLDKDRDQEMSFFARMRRAASHSGFPIFTLVFKTPRLSATLVTMSSVWNVIATTGDLGTVDQTGQCLDPVTGQPTPQKDFLVPRCQPPFAFLKEYLLHWIESLSLIHEISAGILIIKSLLQKVQVLGNYRN
jgi:hypothetical protein